MFDADERVSPELRDEILGVIGDPKADAAYAVRRRTNLFGRDFKASGLQDDAPVRLFKKGKAVFQNPVHEVLRVDGKTGRLQALLHHVSFQSVHEHLEKLQVLNLRGNQIDDEGAECLMRCPWIGGLKRLDLEGNGLSAGSEDRLRGVSGRSSLEFNL